MNNYGRNYAEILKKSIEKWNSQDLDGYMDMYDSSIDAKGFPGVQPGIDSLKDFYQVFWSAVPGSQIIIDDLIEKDDKLVCRFTVTGKHTGTLMGIPPSNKDVQFNGITILQFNENDKCTQRWNQADFLSLMYQIGAIKQ
jgi:predicted ester cyclase